MSNWHDWHGDKHYSSEPSFKDGNWKIQRQGKIKYGFDGRYWVRYHRHFDRGSPYWWVANIRDHTNWMFDRKPRMVCKRCYQPAPARLEGFIKLLEWDR